LQHRDERTYSLEVGNRPVVYIFEEEEEEAEEISVRKMEIVNERNTPSFCSLSVYT
jgi:hypothetical protein